MQIWRICRLVASLEDTRAGSGGDRDMAIDLQ
jgi:L-fucose isomerase-like protein